MSINPEFDSIQFQADEAQKLVEGVLKWSKDKKQRLFLLLTTLSTLGCNFINSTSLSHILGSQDHSEVDPDSKCGGEVVPLSFERGRVLTPKIDGRSSEFTNESELLVGGNPHDKGVMRYDFLKEVAERCKIELKDEVTTINAFLLRADGSVIIAADRTSGSGQTALFIWEQGQAIREFSTTLPSNAPYDLAEDVYGDLYVATDNGMYKYNPEKDTWEEYLPPGMPKDAYHTIGMLESTAAVFGSRGNDSKIGLYIRSAHNRTFRINKNTVEEYANSEWIPLESHDPLPSLFASAIRQKEILPDGRVLIVGDTTDPETASLAMVEFLGDGTPKVTLIQTPISDLDAVKAYGNDIYIGGWKNGAWKLKDALIKADFKPHRLTKAPTKDIEIDGNYVFLTTDKGVIRVPLTPEKNYSHIAPRHVLPPRGTYFTQ